MMGLLPTSDDMIALRWRLFVPRQIVTTNDQQKFHETSSHQLPSRDV